MAAHQARTRSMAGSILLLALAGCTTGPASSGAPASPSATAPPPAEVATQSLQDVERYWTTTYPTISGGKPFVPVQGGYHPYTQADPPSACGAEAGEYQPNAFYCPVGDFIAWDIEN